MRKPVFPVPVAGFILKMIFGEMSGVILEGSRVSDEKLLSSGFHFSFEKLEDALKGCSIIYPCLEIDSSFSISTTSIVFPKTLIIPSFLKSDNVLMTLAVLMPI